MQNEDDLEDCIQAGYLKLWKRLQHDPTFAADKSISYIVKAIEFWTKAQRFSHKRHYKKLVLDADPYQYQNLSLSTHRIDTWIDLESAFKTVVSQIEDQPVLLYAFYSVITQASLQGVCSLFNLNPKTIQKYRKQVRTALAFQLDGYGTKPVHDPEKPIFTPPGARKKRSQPPQTDPQLVTSNAPSPDITSIAQQHRENIRQQIRPFERRTQEPVFPTKWGGEVRFSNIMQDQDIRNVAYAKTLRLGLAGDDREDCVQRGFIKLWQKLKDDPNMLADRGQGWVGVYVALSGCAYQIHRDNRRNLPPDAKNVNLNLGDEYLPTGLKRYHGERHAGWAREIDEQIDITKFMGMMADRYADDTKKLFALYAYTTSVSVKDVASTLHLHSKNFSTAIGNQVRKELQDAATEYFDLPVKPKWQEMLKNGEGLEHITRIAERIMDNHRLLLALYVVTTSAKRKDVAQLFGIGLTCFCKEISEIKAMLTAQY
jgi:hypothetical protein